ncbi:OLC1v1013331C1 [Oldenlandia corymbosa var. corymbosa]|uniref:OLC1v1013331C1 n=1 Tax=Oldenlandia corymbosa var. corymbosa TaxID=529605 RepID=A0AAV1E0J3_OLDCO|nr:OLC1v1013331C1 [Oldenlandia corymbosa var. corymbosa]
MRHVGVQIQIEGGANRRVFANIHINKKGRCQLYGNALEEFFRDIGLGPSTIMHIVYYKDANLLRIFHFYNDGCQRLSLDDTANIGNCYLLSLDLNTASRCDISRRYFGTIGWPSHEKTARVIDDNGNHWLFPISMDDNEPSACDYHMPKYPNRFVVEGDIRAIMVMKKIPAGIKLGFRINARKVANKEALILEVL